jgi:hypothetical protein
MAVGGAIKGISGNRAAKKAKKSADKMLKKGDKQAAEALAFKEANPFEIPDAVKNSLALAENELGNSTLQTNLERQADAALAGSVSRVERSATSGADALAAISKVYGQSQENYTAAAVAGAQERQGDLNNLYQAQAQLSDYQSIQYDQNINMPYLQRMELAQGRIAGGLNAQGQAMAAKTQAAGNLGEGITQLGSAALGVDWSKYKK